MKKQLRPEKYSLINHFLAISFVVKRVYHTELHGSVLTRAWFCGTEQRGRRWVQVTMVQATSLKAHVGPKSKRKPRYIQLLLILLSNG